MYRMAIGLDPSAFPGGEAIQSLALSFNPGLTTTVAGVAQRLRANRKISRI